MRKISTFLLALIFVMILASPAWAAESAVQRLTGDVVELALYAIGLLLTALLSKLILAAEKKFKVDVPDPFEVKLKLWLDKGIHYAEEQGIKVAKKKAGAVSVPDKLDTAAQFILDTSNEKKIVSMGREWLKKMIEARFNERRKSEIIAGPDTRTIERQLQ